MKYLRKAHAKFLLTLTSISLTILLVMPLGCGKKAEKPTPTPAAKPAPAADSIGNVPHISDIHFNPFYDTTLLPQLITAEVNQWESIFETSKIKGFGTVSSDETNYTLLVSSLKDMAETSKNPDFIIFTGDFLAHEFPDKFKNHAPEGNDYDIFVEKTIEFVVLMFEKYFPDTPVYVSLGNNDCYAGDYQIIPEGKFLKKTTPVLADKFLENPENRSSFAATYLVGGYFTVAPRGTENTLIISLNSNFFSPKHNNTVNYDPGKRQLDRHAFSLKNYVLYYLNLDITDPNWAKEYAFNDVYGQTAITVATMLTIYHAIKTDPAVRKSYMNYYNVSDRPHPGLTDANWKAYWCGMGNWTQTSFESCNSAN
jgi:hypothetical protein